jgi:hypothetical protein
MNAEQIKALLDGATKGPWLVRMASHGPIDIVAPDGRDILVMYGGGVDEKTADNARLIAAAPDLAQAALTAMAERDALQARVAELAAFVGEFAEAKFEALPRGPVRSPEDEPDPATDATTVWAWQEDARALLSKGSTLGPRPGEELVFAQEAAKVDVEVFASLRKRIAELEVGLCKAANRIEWCSDILPSKKARDKASAWVEDARALLSKGSPDADA